ncbi:MAG: efflux RND transporter periplasmic adaptor subunit [Bacteroidales bacterium]|nr:efflux RND transporter periplasmic adaptor subunit [Bacteroidales bacterium]
MNSKKILRYLLIGAVILIVFAVIGKKAGWFGKATVYDVAVENPELRNITEVIIANGKIQPETEVKITPDVSGEIVELSVNDGDQVKKGQFLLKIKPDNYISMRDRAEAAVNTAKANLANARARLAQVQAQFDQTSLSHDRNKTLFNEGAISKADWDASVAAYNMAKADIDAAEQSARSAEYSIKSAEASLKEAEEDLRKTTLFAPIDGTISVLHVEKGERVVGTSMMSGTELLRVADLDRMELLVEVNENDIVRVKLNDTALIEVDAYLDRKFKGLVTEIANSANSTGSSTDQVTNFDVKILILKDSYKDLISDAKPHPLRPGMSATADIQTQSKYNILTVPIEAITSRADSILQSDSIAQKPSDENKEVVYLYNNGFAKLQLVKTGIQDSYYIEIIEGISIEDKVIVAPFNIISKKLEDGIEVNQVTKEELFKNNSKEKK